jgi:hypothetical protein
MLTVKGLMEVPMVKIILIIVGTAVPAFGAGLWTQATLAEHQHVGTRVVVSTPSTLSPSEMHRNVKLDDVPVQYMQGDFN